MELIRELADRDGGWWCNICGEIMPPSDDIHIDHIHPVELGGSNAKENLQAVHAYCNLKKNTNLMEECWEFVATGQWWPPAEELAA